MNLGIVGCGGMGGGHAIAIASGTGNAVWNADSADGAAFKGSRNTDISKKLALAGVYDIDPVRRKWAADRGFKNYESYEAMLADDNVDIILIATPNHLHKDEAIAAMRAGKHVLCEKPVTPTSAELEEILKVSEETGKVFYPRQNRRWDEDFLIIREIYEKDLLGKTFNMKAVLGSRAYRATGGKRVRRGMMSTGASTSWTGSVHVPEKIKKVFCSLTHITNSEVDDGFKSSDL